MNNIKFANHHAVRVIEILFPEGYQVRSAVDLSALKQAWMDNLKSWHSPYTCLLDLRNFDLPAEFETQFSAMIKFFKNFFMRKIVGFRDETSKLLAVDFEVLVGYEQAVQQTPLSREQASLSGTDDLRSKIQIDNDFNAHVMEVSFSSPVVFQTAADIATLSSKLKNILMLWHSPYSVLFNCINCTFSEEAKVEFAKLERFLKSFFCKAIIGYAPVAEKETYPFPVLRARHKAAALLEHSGLTAGDAANCSTRKTPATSRDQKDG